MRAFGRNEAIEGPGCIVGTVLTVEGVWGGGCWPQIVASGVKELSVIWLAVRSRP